MRRSKRLSLFTQVRLKSLGYARKFGEGVKSRDLLDVISIRFCLSLFLTAAVHVVSFPIVWAQNSVPETQDAILLLQDRPVRVQFSLIVDGVPLSAIREQLITSLMERLDENNDGVLSHDEWQKSPLTRFGKKKVDNAFLQSLKTSRAVTRKEVENELSRFGELISYREDEAIAEEANRIFQTLDADGSGIIEPHEFLTASDLLRSLDRDNDMCINFAEFTPDVTTTEETPLAGSLNQISEVEPKAFTAKQIRDIRDIRLAGEILKTYDRNQDRLLSRDELNWSEEQFSALDQDGNGALDATELRQLSKFPVSLSLRVDLRGGSLNGPPLEVLDSDLPDLNPKQRLEVVRLQFGDTAITFSLRESDPVQQSLDAALIQFNSLDGDGNGYLTLEEAKTKPIFEKIWFPAMDLDGDGMLYAQEMEQFVRAICEPAATSCQISLLDLGPGYFQMLDTNGDGRISERELRGLATSLAELETRPGNGIQPKTKGRTYSLEFSRGSYHAFGGMRRAAGQGIILSEREAIGPEWFRAIDRNRDGDLTYLSNDPRHPPEFLFSLELAREMDTDGDGLISWLEAEAYEASLRKQTLPQDAKTAQTHEVSH